MAKGFTKKQVLEAIRHSEYTYTSVAKYLAEHFADNGRCADVTARDYIEKYGDVTRNAFRRAGVTMRDMAMTNIKKALEGGDVKTSKWVLERLEREEFGREGPAAAGDDGAPPADIRIRIVD